MNEDLKKAIKKYYQLDHEIQNMSHDFKVVLLKVYDKKDLFRQLSKLKEKAAVEALTHLDDIYEVYEFVNRFNRLEKFLDENFDMEPSSYQELADLEFNLDEARRDLVRLATETRSFGTKKGDPYYPLNNETTRKFLNDFAQDYSKKYLAKKIKSAISFATEYFYTNADNNENFRGLSDGLSYLSELENFKPDNWAYRNLKYPNIHLKNIPPDIEPVLQSNIDDIRLAYVYGCFRAGIALCRSCLETTLKIKFDIDPNDKDMTLGKIINSSDVLNSKEFRGNKHLRDLMTFIKEKGDDALHNYEIKLDNQALESRLFASMTKLRTVIESIF